MRSRLMQYRSDPLMQNHSGVDNHASILPVGRKLATIPPGCGALQLTLMEASPH
jgi:hypothetical protein